MGAGDNGGAPGDVGDEVRALVIVCGGGERELERRSEKGQRGGLGRGLYRPGVLRRRRRGSGADWRLPCRSDGVGDLPSGAAPLPGQRKERGAREGKGKGGADGRGLRAVREKERARVGG